MSLSFLGEPRSRHRSTPFFVAKSRHEPYHLWLGLDFDNHSIDHIYGLPVFDMIDVRRFVGPGPKIISRSASMLSRSGDAYELDMGRMHDSMSWLSRTTPLEFAVAQRPSQARLVTSYSLWL